MPSQQNPFDMLIDAVRLAVREEVGKALQSAPKEKEVEPEADWLKADDLARKYKLPKTLFEQKGREGAIKRTKPGKHVLFNVADVERYLREQAAGGTEKTNH